MVGVVGADFLHPSLLLGNRCTLLIGWPDRWDVSTHVACLPCGHLCASDCFIQCLAGIAHRIWSLRSK